MSEPIDKETQGRLIPIGIAPIPRWSVVGALRGGPEKIEWDFGSAMDGIRKLPIKTLHSNDLSEQTKTIYEYFFQTMMNAKWDVDVLEQIWTRRDQGEPWESDHRQMRICLNQLRRGLVVLEYSYKDLIKVMMYEANKSGQGRINRQKDGKRSGEKRRTESPRNKYCQMASEIWKCSPHMRQSDVARKIAKECNASFNTVRSYIRGLSPKHR